MSKERERAKNRKFDIDNRGNFGYNSNKRKSVPKGTKGGNRESSFGDSTAKSRPGAVYLIAVAVLVVCLCILGIYIYQTFETKKNAEDLDRIYDSNTTYKVIHAQTEAPAADDTAAENTDQPAEDTAAVTEIQREPLVLTAAAAEYLMLNPDTVGHVRIPNAISEVVVQGDDNIYYLDHNFYGSVRQCGTCFADYRNVVNDYPDLQSDNIILYSHNQKDGSMFGNMDYYRWNLKYWQENPFIYFSNNYEESTYVIFSSFVTNSLPEHDNGNVFDYWNYVEFTDDYPYDTFISEVTARSEIITGIDVNESDKFLTLQTCSYEWEEARHVIVARKLRGNETEASIINTADLQTNPDPKMPAIYYKYNGGSYSGN